MGNKKDGGPAFPAYADLGSRENYASGKTVEQGMSLRDYFAAKAMQAQVHVVCDKSGDYEEHMEYTPGWSDEFALGVAMEAYTFADAMLKAREQ